MCDVIPFESEGEQVGAEKFYLRIGPKNVTINVVSAIYGVSPSAEAWCEDSCQASFIYPPQFLLHIFNFGFVCYFFSFVMSLLSDFFLDMIKASFRSTRNNPAMMATSATLNMPVLNVKPLDVIPIFIKSTTRPSRNILSMRFPIPPAATRLNAHSGRR